jgi:hypothetical protein
VRRGDDEVEVREGVVVGREVALGVDVRLDAVEHFDGGVRGDFGDGDGLFLQGCLVEADAPDHPGAGRVVGDDVVVVAAGGRRLDHLGDRVAAVRPVRVGVEVPPYVVDGEEVGQVVVEGRLDLPAVLAELGGRRSHVECAVDVVLVAPADLLADALTRLGVVDVGHVEDPVLVDLQPPPDGDVPEVLVVVPAPREMLERAPVLFRDDHAEVDPDAVGPDARLLGAGLDDGVGAVPVGEGVDHGSRVLAGGEHVHVADGLLPAPDGAGHLGALDGVERIHVDQRVVGERAGLAQPLALAGQLGEGNVVEDVLLGLRAEPLELPDLAGLGGRLQFVEGRDPQRLVEAADGLRADALDGGEAGNVDRQLLAKLLEFPDLAGLDVFDDLRGDGLADGVDLLDGVPSLRDQVIDRSRRVTDVLGGPTVRTGFVLLVHRLEEVGHLLQSARHLVVAAHRRFTARVISGTCVVLVAVAALTVRAPRRGPYGRRFRRHRPGPALA